MNQLIYLDNAATTMTYPEVVEKMLPYYSENYGNPSGVYEFAQKSNQVLNESRKILADILGTKPEQIYFTSGGTESDNWALKAIAKQYRDKGNHIITSKIEHHAIHHTCDYLETEGFEISYIDVDENGIIKMEELKKAIKDTTILISVMFANNEIGTIQPIKEIGKIAREKHILFHTDAVQAFAHLPINVDEYNIDLLSASAHKFNGPKGIGFMYIRENIEIPSFMHGGAQENSKRAGTHNVPGIVGMAKAAAMSAEKMNKTIKYETELRDYLIQRILREIPYTRLNGHAKLRLPNNTNFSFQFVDGEALLVMLDMKGICASSASACSAKSTAPSHVLLAIGLPEELVYGSLRLTLSQKNTKEEIDYVVEELKDIVESLRKLSPVYEEFVKIANT